MVTREELFQETEQQIEETTELLRSCFHDLGAMVYDKPSILPGEMGVSLLGEIRKAQDEKARADGKRAEDLAFVKEYDSKRERKLLLDEEVENIREREKDVRLRLGALIYEQCSLGLLDRDKFSSVYADADEEKLLSEKAEGKSLFSRLASRSALSRLKKCDSSRYLDYSSLADSEENAVAISGINAKALVEELETIKAEKEKKEEEREELSVFISENVSKRRGLEKGGLEENEDSVNDSQVSLRECLINYGNYLYDRGGSWIGEDTPPEVLDILQKIIDVQNEYKTLNERKNQLKAEAKADDYKALIEEEKERIRILEGEREKIALQIEDIKKEIARLESLVDRLIK